MTPKLEPYLKSGDRVSYAVSSGFCTQVYEGTVLKVNNIRSYIEWDFVGRVPPSWVDNEYLKVLK